MSQPRSSLAKQKTRDPFVSRGLSTIDYKNYPLLKRVGISFFAKIKPRKYTGVQLQNQKKMAVAIKRARFMALVPFVR
jgi:small subunit ribosomal protein S18